MKANELKATDLMVGDWVICYHPSRPQSFERVSVGLLHTLDQQEHGHIKEDSPLFRIVQPIPLTPEILEKNGFVVNAESPIVKNYHFWFDNEEDCIIVEIHKKTEYAIVDYLSLEKGMRACITMRKPYVHELQHILRLCKIDKEIVV